MINFLQSLDFLLFSFYGLVFFLIALRIRQNYLKGEKTSTLLKYFMMMFFLWSIFEVLRGAPHIYIILGREDLFPQAMRWGYIISNFFLILTSVYALRISAPVHWPKYQKLGIGLVLFLGIISEIILIVVPFVPRYFVEGGFIVTLMNGPKIALPPLGFSLLIGLGTTAVAFLYEAIRGKIKGVLRTRSWLVGIGILLIIISGPSHNFFETARATFILDMVQLFGKIVIATGVLMFKPNEEEPGQFYGKPDRRA